MLISLYLKFVDANNIQPIGTCGNLCDHVIFCDHVMFCILTAYV